MAEKMGERKSNIVRVTGSSEVIESELELEGLHYITNQSQDQMGIVEAPLCKSLFKCYNQYPLPFVFFILLCT